MSASDNAAQSEWMESMLGDFVDESGQLLGRLNENLLRLETLVRLETSEGDAQCDESLLNEMFRSAHSLKGLSAMLGLSDINGLTHRLENVFDAARKDGLQVTSDVVELMFRAVDHLERLVESLKDPAAEPVDCAPVLDGIRQLLQAHGVERNQSSQADAEKAFAACTAPPDAAAAVAATAEPIPPVAATPPCESPEPPGPLDGVEDESGVSDKYLPIFIDETGLGLDRLAELLLTFEGGGSQENVKRLMHAAHQIKGSAATIGLNRAAKMAHVMEDLLQVLVETGKVPSPREVDMLLRCTDAYRQYLESLKRGQAECEQFVPLARDLLAARLERKEGGHAADSPPQPGGAPEHRVSGPAGQTAPPSPRPQSLGGIDQSLRDRVSALTSDGATTLLGSVRFQAGLPMAGLKAQLVHEKLAAVGEICHFEPPAAALDDVDTLDHVCFGLVTESTIERVRACLRIAGVEEVLLEWLTPAEPPVIQPPTAASTGGEAAAATASEPAVTVASPNAGKSAARPAPCETDANRGKARPVDNTAIPTETLRVDIERLDELMNLAGELVISKARFARFGDRLKSLRSVKRWSQVLSRISGGLGQLTGGSEQRAEPQSAAALLEHWQNQTRRFEHDLDELTREMRALEGVQESVNDLYEAVHQLDRVSDGIQHAVMDTRMLPIGPLFTRFKRVIRDITRSNGKSVRLVINGEKTKLDKRMIDELGDPLIHLVRNAADHGIEPPDVRQAAGKPPEGTISLDAFHRGNHVVIQVRDDGAGLNTERVLQKCLERGLLSESDAQRMTPHQINQMIWAPGLSTAEKVTEVSGRGMGMDIVKSKIELLHGTVDLESSPGQGTLFSVKLPLTLAILPSLLVEIGKDVFAMPMEAVLEIVRIPQDQLSTVHGQRSAWVRNRAVSIIELEHTFHWAQRRPREATNASDDATIVIVGEGKGSLGLAVDAVIGEQDVVIKSIAENYQNVPGITGASILGDGRVSLILDVAALLQMASNPAAVTGCS